MNSLQAKSIPINNYLLSLGIIPSKIKGQIYWYSSPFREDKEASFKVDLQKNLWYDFGIGKGGNILEFVMLLNACNISEALKIISSDNHLSYERQDNNTKPDISFFEQQIEDFTLKQLKSLALIEYLQKRAIEIPIATNYCSEAHYVLNNKKYFGIAFKNDTKGYEIRNRYSKINLFGKDITTIKKSNITINVFEGFIDFLSYICIYPQSEDDSNLILNGVGMVNKSIDILKNYKNCLLFLDNDKSGKEATKQIIDNIPFAKDMSYIYKDFKDMNEYLLMKRKKVISSLI